MEMNNGSRNRAFDRSTRDPATLKKPRLITEEPTILRGNNHNNSNGGGRPLVQRQPPAGLRPAAERDRDSDSIRGGGGGYQPQSLSQMQHQQHQELVSQYRTALAELTFNSKPIITNLTIIAGENVHAAKAIAATICNNILEVPSDQKLPSLYLLDSIVKNIGRDYIRHFAAKLPEVFCKAYRQVDSAIHSGMRHLFGTWKGVFPPQCLQMIEKELEFQSAGNGSSGLTTSRSESQPQRPARSIHVNPKYLEARQKLQQSGRVKGAVGDMTMNLINPAEDTERPERTSVNTNSGRPRADPRLKMHNIQQAQRNVESGLGHENNTPAAGDFDYGSDRLSPSVTSFGKSSERIVEQGFDNSWYGPGSNNTETISSQRNGFDMKHGFPNPSAPRSAITDAEVHTMNTLSSKRGSEVNRSWKNSEEEEYMWDDMSARPAISGTSSSSKRDPRLHFETERLGFESHLRKPQQMHDLGPRLERDALSDLASTEQKDQPAFIQRMTSLRSQGLSSTDGNSHFGSGRKLLDHAEGFSTSFSGGSTANPLPRTSLQLLTGSSHIGAHHRSLSSSLSLYQSKRALPDLGEQDRPHLLPDADGKAARSQGHLNMGLSNQSPQDSFQMMPQNLHPGNTRKSQLHTLQSPSPQLSLHPKKHAPLQSLQPESLSEPYSQSSKLLPPQTSVAANPLVSSSELNSRPPVPGGRPPQFPSLGSGVVAPHESTSLPAPILQGKADRQLLPSGIPPSLVGMAMSTPSSSAGTATSDPVSSLLSTLVAKGLISASKADSSSSFATPAKIQSPERLKVPPIKVSSVSTSSTNDELSLPKPVVSTVTISQSCKGEIKSLIGFDFKPDVIRESHPAVISELTNDLPHQCAACGLRFKLQERFDRHIEWHTLRNSESDAPSKASRRWFSSSDDWVSGKTGIPSGDETTDTTEEALVIDGEQMVTADESQCVCVLCGELFNDCYIPERQKWMFKGAVYLGIGDNATSGPIVHANCISERSYSDLGLADNVKVENDV